MQRITEPELMNEADQAEIYAMADFEEPHSHLMKMFDHAFPDTQITGNILDLGCGPGDISFRCAYRFPKGNIIGIDGAATMIHLANRRRAREVEVRDRILFIEGFIPGAPIPRQPYDLIISNSLLHHLHDPEPMWQTIKEYASPGTKIFIVDLFRPTDQAGAQQMVNSYAAGEPELLQRDFYSSLLAAFEPQEVEGQLAGAGLTGLSIEIISDRHLMVYGEMTKR